MTHAKPEAHAQSLQQLDASSPASHAPFPQTAIPVPVLLDDDTAPPLLEDDASPPLEDDASPLPEDVASPLPDDPLLDVAAPPIPELVDPMEFDVDTLEVDIVDDVDPGAVAELDCGVPVEAPPAPPSAPELSSHAVDNAAATSAALIANVV